MPINKEKKIYENSHAARVESFPIVARWIRGQQTQDVEFLRRSRRLFANNIKEFTDAFGEPVFSWTNESRSQAWKFQVTDDVVLYVFSGMRGTSYEVSGLDSIDDEVQEKIVAILRDEIFPHTGRRWRLVDELVADAVESARQDPTWVADVFRSGTKGFENMTEAELEQAYLDAGLDGR